MAVGSVHDYGFYKHSCPKLPKAVKVTFDLVVLGVGRDFLGLNCVLLFKWKNPGRGKIGVRALPLSLEQRLFNKCLSSARVVVEHINSRVKKFWIFGEEFRSRLKKYDIMINIVCGIVNFCISVTLTA